MAVYDRLQWSTWRGVQWTGVYRFSLPGRGTQLWVMRHVPPKRPYFFSLAFTERPPFLPTSTHWPPILNKLLVTERPWHIFVTQRPLIFVFNSQASDNFMQKNRFFENFVKFEEMLRNFWPFWPWKPLFFMHFTERPPFLCALSLKDPFFWRNLSPKDPYIWGAWWHSYVTFTCECPPRSLLSAVWNDDDFHTKAHKRSVVRQGILLYTLPTVEFETTFPTLGLFVLIWEHISCWIQWQWKYEFSQNFFEEKKSLKIWACRLHSYAKDTYEISQRHLWTYFVSYHHLQLWYSALSLRRMAHHKNDKYMLHVLHIR